MKTTQSLFLLCLFAIAVDPRATAQTYTFTTLAGVSGQTGSADGTGSSARFHRPRGLAIDSAGNVFVTDAGNDVTDPGNNTVRKITPAGVVTTLAGLAGRPGYADGTGGNARFDGPSGIVVDAADNLYVVDTINSAIRKITPAGVVTTLAGGPRTRPLDYPSDIAIDRAGNLYVTDPYSYSGWKITPAGVLSALRDSAGEMSGFFTPVGIAVDGDGNIYVGHFLARVITKMTPTGTITVFAGGGSGSGDGAGSAAVFGGISGVAIDTTGNLFIADAGQHSIRKITPSGMVSTLAVTGGADWAGSTVRFGSLRAIAVDKLGNLFVADGEAILKGVPTAGALAPVILSAPAGQHVSPGTRTNFTVAASGANLTYQWKKNGVAIGDATTATYTLASATAADMGFYSVVVNSAGGSIESNVAILTVAAGGTGRLANLSTRGLVPAGGELTVGFVIRGSGGKSLLVRAVGPTLSSFGVVGALADPRLDLIPANASAATAVNDDWAGGAALTNAFAAAGAFALPAASKDAAILATLPAASYTARSTSVAGGGSGIALAEVYDRDSSGVTSRLVNLSTLGFVGTGAQALVPGFVIDGTAPKLVLIRAVGPGLVPFGVVGTLADPQLALVPLGKTFTVGSNDNWDGSAAAAAAFAQAGAFALAPGSKDAALIVRLPPGGYTVTVSGAGNTTGTALVEIYDLDP